MQLWYFTYIIQVWFLFTRWCSVCAPLLEVFVQRFSLLTISSLFEFLFFELSLSFCFQIMSPHHSDHMTKESQISWIDATSSVFQRWHFPTQRGQITFYRWHLYRGVHWDSYNQQKWQFRKNMFVYTIQPAQSSVCSVSKEDRWTFSFAATTLISGPSLFKSFSCKSQHPMNCWGVGWS